MVSILSVSNVYIFSKAALNMINIIQFGFYWFGMGILWNLLLSNKKVALSKIREIDKRTRWIYVLIGIMEIISTTAFFYAIMTIENPSVASFLGNLTPVFVTILGIVILKEKFNFLEITGAFLTLAGAFIISYKGNLTLESMFLPGTGYVLISSIVYSIATIIVKKNIDKMSPALLSLNRLVFIFAFATILMIATGQSFSIPPKALYLIAIGSLLGPFLAANAGYNALKYIEVSKKSILGSARSFIVMLEAYLYFGTLPKQYQIIGGIITVAGVLLVSMGKMLLKKERREG